MTQREGPNDAFYKGLIQLAGAFVHLQKERLRPAAALFRLAAANLEGYPAIHEKLDIEQVLELINGWAQRLETDQFHQNPLATETAPRLKLRP